MRYCLDLFVIYHLKMRLDFTASSTAKLRTVKTFHDDNNGRQKTTTAEDLNGAFDILQVNAVLVVGSTRAAVATEAVLRVVK